MLLCAMYIRSQDFSPQWLQVSIHNKNRMSTGNLHCKRHEKYTDDNVKMCKETREVLKNKRCQIFSKIDFNW